MALELQWFAWDFTGSSHLAFPNGANILCGNSETITSYTTLQEFSAYISWNFKSKICERVMRRLQAQLESCIGDL